MDLTGKVALVTGAGSGIGAATATLMAELGARVGVLSRTAAEVERIAAEARGKGGDAIPLTADVADERQLGEAVERLVGEFGGLDIAVANAGINGRWAPIDELELEDFDRTVSINQRGTFLTVRLAVPHLKRRGGGSIVVTSSINGNVTFSTKGSTIYSGTKAAQVAMARVLAAELGPHRIRVNAVLPGSIETEIEEHTERDGVAHAGRPTQYPEGQIPLTGKEIGSSRQVARVIAFLASDQADHVSGAAVTVDGAQSLIV